MSSFETFSSAMFLSSADKTPCVFKISTVLSKMVWLFEFSQNIQKIKKLLNSDNQTLVLKTVEILKKHGILTTEDKNIALEKVSNENIKNIILAI